MSDSEMERLEGRTVSDLFVALWQLAHHSINSPAKEPGPAETAQQPAQGCGRTPPEAKARQPPAGQLGKGGGGGGGWAWGGRGRGAGSLERCWVVAPFDRCSFLAAGGYSSVLVLGLGRTPNGGRKSGDVHLKDGCAPG